MTKTFWVSDSRLKFICIILFLIWVGFIVFFYMKADEITRDPCSICAERMGVNVLCTTLDSPVPAKRVYYPNGTIYNENPKVKYFVPEINLTGLSGLFEANGS